MRNRPEPKHRQECLCHTHPAVLEQMLMRARVVWHRHSCLCLGNVQCPKLLTGYLLRSRDFEITVRIEIE
jgi:hypothetical protein